MVKVFENSSTHSYTNLVQDPTVKYAKKHFKIYFALCYRKGSFECFLECFLMKKGLGTLEVKLKYLIRGAKIV